MKQIFLAVNLTLLLGLLSPTSAHAYLDPGAASVIVTSVLGALAAISYTFRSYIARIKTYFSKKGTDQEQGQGQEQGQEQGQDDEE